MKICFITSNIANIGGQERVLANLLNGLVTIKDIEVSILFTSPKKVSYKFAYPLDKRIKVLWHKKIVNGKYSYLGLKLLRAYNKKVHKSKNVRYLKNIYFPHKEIRRYEKYFGIKQFDILIGVSPRQSGILGMINCQARKVAWLHNTYERYFEKKDNFQWNQKELYQELFTKLDKVIVLTDNDVKIYKEKFGISSQRIYNPLSFSSKNKSVITGKRLLFVGRLDYDIKGLDLLTDILGNVILKIPDIVLTVVGDGAGKKQFMEDAKRKNVINNIIMAGFTDNVLEFYLNADVLLVTSRVEGFGLVVTEAMECGVPVVTFDTTGPSEIVTDKVDGFCVKKYDVDKFAENVIEICKNEELHKKMSESAIKKAACFNRNIILEEWNKLFYELMVL